MPEPKGTSNRAFRVLVESAGLELTPKEMVELKAIYDLGAVPLAALHELDLGEEDLAVVYTAGWADPGQDPEVL